MQISSERMSDVAFGPSLNPFRVEGDRSDIDIRVEWIAELARRLQSENFSIPGQCGVCMNAGAGFQFEFSTPSLGEGPTRRFVVDRGFRSAALHMSEKSFAGRLEAADPLDYPLDELLIMHRLTQEKAIELHSCGIVRPDGTGNLFVGHSGAGKSTTTRLWTAREDVEVLSDDRIIVRRDETAVETPRHAAGAAGMHEVLRLRDCSASRNSHFAQDDKLKTNPASLGMTNQKQIAACGCMGRRGMARRRMHLRGVRRWPGSSFLSMGTGMC